MKARWSLLFLLFLLSVEAAAQRTEPQLLDAFEEQCDIRKEIRLYKTRIAQIRVDKDTTYFTIAFLAMCGQEWEGKMDVKENRVHFGYIESDVEVFCTCCYTITYKVLGYRPNEHELYFRDQKIAFSDQEYYQQEIRTDTLETGERRRSMFLDGELQ